VLGAVAEAGGGLAVKKHRGRAFGNGVHGAADAQSLVALAGGGFSADENIRRAVEDGAAHMGLGTGFDLGADVMVADGSGKFGHGVVSFILVQGLAMAEQTGNGSICQATIT